MGSFDTQQDSLHEVAQELVVVRRAFRKNKQGGDARDDVVLALRQRSDGQPRVHLPPS